MIACFITTYNRPKALERTLPQVTALGVPVLVVDDASDCADENRALCENRALYLRLPQNRGLAAAMNIGLSFWMADDRIKSIGYFQDDVDVHPKTLEIMRACERYAPLLTGHDAKEHPEIASGKLAGRQVKYKHSCRATHMHAQVSFWKSVYPIPTYKLGAPKAFVEGKRGIGSNADWWIVRDAPYSIQRIGANIVCVPNLVRTFLWSAKDSCWNNRQKSGEDAPLARI